MTEAVGFWITIAGILCTLIVTGMALRGFKDTDSSAYVVFVLIVFLLAVSLSMVGMHVMCVGNKGKYPPYPIEYHEE